MTVGKWAQFPQVGRFFGRGSQVRHIRGSIASHIAPQLLDILGIPAMEEGIPASPAKIIYDFPGLQCPAVE